MANVTVKTRCHIVNITPIDVMAPNGPKNGLRRIAPKHVTYVLALNFQFLKPLCQQNLLVALTGMRTIAKQFQVL